MNSRPNIRARCFLSVCYRASKIKVTLFLSLQIFLVFTGLAFTILFAEYRNLYKNYVHDMDFQLKFSNDTDFSLIGYIVTSSALKTKIWIKELYSYAFIESHEDIKAQNNEYTGFKDTYSPLGHLHVEFAEAKPLEPPESAQNKITRFEVEGKISLSSIQRLIRKTEDQLSGKIGKIKFNNYATFEIRFYFITFSITSLVVREYPVSAGYYKKLASVLEDSPNFIYDGLAKVNVGTNVQALMSMTQFPITVENFNFRPFYLKYTNSSEFRFTGELARFSFLSPKEYEIRKNSAKRNNYPQSMFSEEEIYNFLGILKLTQYSRSWTGIRWLKHINYLRALADWNETGEYTKVNISARKCEDSWRYVYNRLGFVVYRYLDMEFFIGSKTV